MFISCSEHGDVMQHEKFIIALLFFQYELCNTALAKSGKPTEILVQMLNDSFLMLSRIEERIIAGFENQSKTSLIRLAKDNIVIIKRLYKIFNTIFKCTDVAISYDVFLYFSHPHFIQYVHVSLEIFFILAPVQEYFPELKREMFEIVLSLVVAHFEIMVPIISETRFTQILEYILQELSRELEFNSEK